MVSESDSNGKPLILCNGARSPATEAFRGMRTQLLLLVRQGQLRHLLITSTGPGEGKSTVAANIALVTARAGQKVLLVDADLHRPQLHTLFGVANQAGLAELLRNPGGSPVDASAATRFCLDTNVPNLSLLPAGELPADAAEIFAGTAMREIVAALGASYDLVIYDAPPVLSVADPTVLAAYADGVLLVVRVGLYPRDAIQQAHATLVAVHAKLIGAVLNGFETATGGAYYGYYRYPYQHA